MSVNTERINANISVLVQRYENIMAMAAVSIFLVAFILCDSADWCHSQAKNHSHTATAVEGFQLENEVTGLVSSPCEAAQAVKASPPTRRLY